MKAANLRSSERLQRVNTLLADGREYSTLEIIQATGVVAINAAVAELRQNGVQIECRRRGNAWYYRRVDV